MRHLILTPWSFAFMTLAVGCGPARPKIQAERIPPLTPGGSTETTTGESSTTGSSESGDDEEVVCEPETEYHKLCQGECVWTDRSDENCGDCQHACAPVNLDGHCELGRCTSIRAACITADDGVTTCAEYCASIGELCGSEIEAVGHPCYGAMFLYESDQCSLSSYIFQDHDDPSAACDTPIPFGTLVDSIMMANSARCCCTQHGGE